MKSRKFKDAVYEQLARVASAFNSSRRVKHGEILAQGERNVESLAFETNQSVAGWHGNILTVKMGWFQ